METALREWSRMQNSVFYREMQVVIRVRWNESKLGDCVEKVLTLQCNEWPTFNIVMNTEP